MRQIAVSTGLTLGRQCLRRLDPTLLASLTKGQFEGGSVLRTESGVKASGLQLTYRVNYCQMASVESELAPVQGIKKRGRHFSLPPGKMILKLNYQSVILPRTITIRIVSACRDCPDGVTEDVGCGLHLECSGSNIIVNIKER